MPDMIFFHRFFLGSTNTVPSLMALAKNFRLKPLLAAAALSAARNLVTTEEAVLGLYVIDSVTLVPVPVRVIDVDKLQLSELYSP